LAQARLIWGTARFSDALGPKCDELGGDALPLGSEGDEPGSSPHLGPATKKSAEPWLREEPTRSHVEI